MARTAILERAAVVRHGRRLEYFTIAWNALESLVAVVAGAIAGSISLVGFGIDSFIEVTSGSVRPWRMSVDAEVQRRELNERKAPEDCRRLLSCAGGLHRVRICVGLVVPPRQSSLVSPTANRERLILFGTDADKQPGRGIGHISLTRGTPRHEDGKAGFIFDSDE
jgi:hypothetical protein